ncbi:MAG TPA: cation:proton antiporter [Rhodospirillales bacterium]|nr:cation:proton antiporter [Rhodospirillales bacterium]
MVESVLANPLALLGVVLVLGALFGDVAERARVPWISGCIVAGVLLGPAATNVLRWPEMAALDGLAQVSLAVIAFNIGSQLVLTRLKAIGRSIALLALAQLLAPFVPAPAPRSPSAQRSRRH